METWFAKSAKATMKYSRKAIDRVSESASEGAKWGSGETKENSGDGSVLGTIFGGALGAVYGIGRAAVGVPKDITRNRSKKRFQHGITVWGPRERLRCSSPLAIEMQQQQQLAVRVVCVRHGHARHNDLGGVGSMGNRDAELTHLGVEEAKSCSELLKDIEFDMVVVSPYRRCLETASLLLGQRGKEIPHEIQPMAGEHNGGSFENDDLNLIRSAVARGDLGSEKEVLMGWFSATDYPQYQRGFTQLVPRWWEHFQASGYETNESFVLRSIALRNWLGSLAPVLWARQSVPGRIPTVLLVSHGGILTQTFDCGNHADEYAERKGGKFQNCEFRVFDVCPGGFFAPPPLPEGFAEAACSPETPPPVNLLPPSPAASAPGPSALATPAATLSSSSSSSSSPPSSSPSYASSNSFPLSPSASAPLPLLYRFHSPLVAPSTPVANVLNLPSGDGTK